MIGYYNKPDRSQENIQLAFDFPLAYLSLRRVVWPASALLAAVAISWCFIGTREAGTESPILLYAAACLLVRRLSIRSLQWQR